MDDLISIIVPIYNTEKYLKRCINSIIEQSYRNIEILLIDDGSTDNSFEICNELKRKDNRIKVFRKENEGVSATRNLGIKYSNGKYICFIDSDDWIEKKYIQILKDSIISYDLSACKYQLIDDKNNKKVCKIDKSFSLNVGETLDILFYNGNYKISYQGYIFNKLFKKDIIEKYNIKFDENIYYNEDRLFVFQYIIHCTNNIFFSNYIGYNYYQRVNSAMNQKKYTKKMYTEFIAFEKMITIASNSQYKHISELIKNEYVNHSLNMFIRYYKENGEIIKIYKDNVKKYLNSIIFSKKITLKSKLSIVKKYIKIALIDF